MYSYRIPHNNHHLDYHAAIKQQNAYTIYTN